MIRGLVKVNTHSAVVQLLLDSYPKRYNINQIAKETSLSVGGVFKSLNQLEQREILSSKTVGNAKLYQLDFSSENGRKFSELILFQKNKQILIKNSTLISKLSLHSDKILMAFFKGGKRPKFLFVSRNTEAKGIAKSIGDAHSHEFLTFSEFTKKLKDAKFFKNFWNSYTPVFGESLFFRLVGEIPNEKS